MAGGRRRRLGRGKGRVWTALFVAEGAGARAVDGSTVADGWSWRGRRMGGWTEAREGETVETAGNAYVYGRGLAPSWEGAV